MSTHARIAAALILAGCANGSSGDNTDASDGDGGFTDGGPRLDLGVDTGAHDATTNDAPIDAGTDASDASDAALDGGGDATTGETLGDSATDLGADTGEETADAGVDLGVDEGSDAGVDLGVDVGVDLGTDTGADLGVDAGADLGVDAGADLGVDTGEDAGATDAGTEASTDATVAPYRHTITIDGVNDFTTATEQFTTTTGPYSAFITWDASNLFVAYDASDVSANDVNKWIFVFLDVDPGAATGATSSLVYTTQSASFPSGFGAEYYLRWKSDDSFSTIEQYAAGAWTTATSTVSRYRNGTYIEFAIPLATLGITTPSKLGVLTYWINQTPSHEATYGGLYTGNFSDGYSALMPMTDYLSADWTTAIAPNDPSREAH